MRLHMLLLITSCPAIKKDISFNHYKWDVWVQRNKSAKSTEAPLVNMQEDIFPYTVQKKERRQNKRKTFSSAESVP